MSNLPVFTPEIEEFLLDSAGKELLAAIETARKAQKCQIAFILGLQEAGKFLAKVTNDDPDNVIYSLITMSNHLWEKLEKHENET